MLTPKTPESVAFAYVKQNVGENYRISNVVSEDGNVRVTFDGLFHGKCPTCGHQIEQKVDGVFSVVVRKKDLKIVGKPNLKGLKRKVVKAGLGFLLKR
nr:hypothetical protein [Candidatus Njordarchaeota archaeon]